MKFSDLLFEVLSEEFKPIHYSPELKNRLVQYGLAHTKNIEHKVTDPHRKAYEVIKNPDKFEFHDVGQGITKIVDKSTKKIHMHV